ncbi:ornithine cyclodeaminase family protein [Achromobacter aloeverae]|uniref:Ornithine cyclodeaminase n=1 Tax=Achromobacter aloeverae TaxID=1750518 RepID=A0A4Q1HMT6_9BURK|nr:ornithine cyclodeaminase family protein [Achromobacter aloeverae]RXN91115.1 ornithine cyclodeaminase [Achromobacter aloeverae]
MTLYLNEADVRQLLPMARAVDEVERAFSAHGRGQAVDIPRRRTRQPGGHLHILQAAAPEIGVIGYKAYYNKPGKPLNTLLHLMNHAQGNTEAIIESDWLGRIRTGAATGVAARYLAREDARVLGLFGYGRHARTQLEAVCTVRDIDEVKVFGRNQDAVRAFCEEMSRKVPARVRPALSREETVRGSDIIVTMTRASEPLFDGRWLEPGQFVAATGSNALDRREIDLETVRRADVIAVDSREVAQGECGDLLPAYENGLIYWENLADMGGIVTGRWPGRTAAAQVTLFESHGMAIQDLYVGAAVLAAARERGMGVSLPMGGADAR